MKIAHLYFTIFNFQFFLAPGRPTFGFGREPLAETELAGNGSLGRERASENAPLAERCLPTFGLRIAPS